MPLIPMKPKIPLFVEEAMNKVDPYDSTLGIQLLGPRDGRCLVRAGEGWGLDLEDYLDRLHELLGRRYPNSRGRGRVCYVPAGEYVFKVPRIEAGILQNLREVRTYLEYKPEADKGGYPDGPHFAACRLDYIWALPVCVMEKVKPIPFEVQPPWASYIDCGQVGTDKTGKIVAYDFG